MLSQSRPGAYRCNGAADLRGMLLCYIYLQLISPSSEYQGAGNGSELDRLSSRAASVLFENDMDFAMSNGSKRAADGDHRANSFSDARSED